jgi:hypothetical protein
VKKAVAAFFTEVITAPREVVVDREESASTEVDRVPRSALHSSPLTGY